MRTVDTVLAWAWTDSLFGNQSVLWPEPSWCKTESLKACLAAMLSILSRAQWLRMPKASEWMKDDLIKPSDYHTAHASFITTHTMLEYFSGRRCLKSLEIRLQAAPLFAGRHAGDTRCRLIRDEMHFSERYFAERTVQCVQYKRTVLLCLVRRDTCKPSIQHNRKLRARD